MRELKKKRTFSSKTYDLGGYKKRLSIHQTPIHYKRDDLFHEIDLTPTLTNNVYLIDKTPYALRILPDECAYRYTSFTGDVVTVSLLTESANGSYIDNKFVYSDVFKDTDYEIRPMSTGCATKLVLKSSDAPKSWQWKIEGNKDLILPLKGFDSAGNVVELNYSYDGDILLANWTGRVSNSFVLRSKKKDGWNSEVSYPVFIDPTVNEAIVTGADDNSSSVGSSFDNNNNTLFAGYLFGDLRNAGLRFPSVAIPQGATISSAVIQLYVNLVAGSPDVDVVGDDQDDAPVLSESNRISSVTPTTASVNLASISTNTAYTFTVNDIVQEIIDRTGWSTSNAIQFAFIGNVVGGSINAIQFAAFEHATRLEAQLDIDYTVAGGGNTPSILIGL